MIRSHVPAVVNFSGLVGDDEDPVKVHKEMNPSCKFPKVLEHE